MRTPVQIDILIQCELGLRQVFAFQLVFKSSREAPKGVTETWHCSHLKLPAT